MYLKRLRRKRAGAFRVNVKKSTLLLNALQKGIRFYRAFSCFR